MPARIPYRRPASSVPMARGATSPAKRYETTDDRMEAKRFYAGRPWRKLRAAVLAESPLCKPCLDAGRIRAAKDVHHVVERRQCPERALDRSNLEPVCRPCHNAKRKAPRP